VNGKWTFNHEVNINNITKHNNIVKLQLPTQEMVNEENKDYAIRCQSINEEGE
jgi:hypothetical protein